MRAVSGRLARGSNLWLMRVTASLAGVSCVAALVATVGAGETRALEVMTPAAPAGKLAFAGGRGEHSALYVANADGSGFRRLLTHEGIGAGSARTAWSPDGTKVAFAEGYGTSGVWVARADGSGLRRVAKNGRDPVWSPDGRLIAFSDSLRVYVVGADGNNRRWLGDSTAVGGGWLPAWSPQGRQVAFGTKDAIVVVDVQDGRRTTIHTAGRLPGHVAWSPDGATLAFVSGDGLYVIGADGLGERRLARHVGYDDFENSPAWSPDGSSLVFEVDSDREYGSDAIFTVGADGSRLHRLTPGDRQNYRGPVWSPDGRQIAFSRTRIRGSYGSDVFVVNLDGTGLRLVTRAFPDDLDYGHPSWALGSVIPSTPRPMRMIRLPHPRTVTTSGIVNRLVRVGTRGAAVLNGRPSGSCTLVNWGRGLVGVKPRPIASGAFSCVDDLGLSATHTYWTLTYEEGHSIAFSELWARSSKRRSRRISVADFAERDFYLGNLRGDATILVYNTWWGAWRTPKGGKLWRLEGERQVLIRAGPDSSPVVAAGSERIAVLRTSREVAILDASGRPIRTISIRPGPVRGAALDGNQLVLLRQSAVEAYGLRTGSLRHRRPIDAPPTGNLILHDAHGDLVVYARGLAITLLRLSSGQSAVLDLPNQAGPTDAALESDGLYYAYNVAHTSKPGRIAFAPRHALVQAFG